VDAKELVHTDRTLQESAFDPRMKRERGRNTGLNAVMASHARAIEVLPPGSASPGFMVKRRGVKRVRHPETRRTGFAPAVDPGELYNELRRKLKLSEGPFSDEPAELIELQRRVLEDEVQGRADVAARRREEFVPRPWVQCGTFLEHVRRTGPATEELKQWDKLIGIPRELPRLKWQPYFRTANVAARQKELTSDHRKKPYDHIFRNPTETHDSIAPSDARRYFEVKRKRGDYGSTADPKVMKNSDEFKSDALISEWILENPSKDPNDDGQYLTDAAAVLGISVSTFYRRIERAKERIRQMQADKNRLLPLGVRMPPPGWLTDEMIDDLLDGYSFIRTKLSKNSPWKWHRLDVPTFGTEAAAVEALKAQKRWRATRERPGDQRHEVEVRKRIDIALAPENTVVLRGRKGWKGVIGQVSHQQE